MLASSSLSHLLHLSPPPQKQPHFLQTPLKIQSFHFSKLPIFKNPQTTFQNPLKIQSFHFSKLPIFKKSNLFPLNCSTSYSYDDDFEVELVRLLDLLPEEMRRSINEHAEFRYLIEVVMDLGRKPLARFPSGDFLLSNQLVTMDVLQKATSQVGDFAVDNRAGISRTLHRISAIRNRKGAIIGLTCRVGRAISGSANLVQDLVKDGASLLLIGPPGVGKTTIIRDIARMLANDYEKRVMIVDTSNEIGGDGDIPHAGIGTARRMQVPHSDMQHKVLIEAVENHMPQVIVIDEIGTKLEAMAASTIAQRGIQLVATAHGITIENLVSNPALEMLVGGVQSVTLGDEEASRRGVQKTVLERKGPSTFSCGVEIISKSELRVHKNLEATVDAILLGRYPKYEVRKMSQSYPKYEVRKTSQVSERLENKIEVLEDLYGNRSEAVTQEVLGIDDDTPSYNEVISKMDSDNEGDSFEEENIYRIFLYGISETSMEQGIKLLKIDEKIEITDNISEADALLALQSKLKKNSGIQAAAKSRGIPVYVTKTNSLAQLTKAIQALLTDYENGYDLFQSEARINDSEKMDALEEARLAIEHTVIPKGEPMELLPRSSNIMLLQKDLIRKYKLKSERVGEEPDVRLRILPFQPTVEEEIDNSERINAGSELETLIGSLSETNGSAYTVFKLPLLPDAE